MRPRNRPRPHRSRPRAAPRAPDLSDPALYINRELSWLDFNARVLALAEDDHLPLLERAKFLAIFSQNLDEFFQVRVAGLKDQVAAGIVAPVGGVYTLEVQGLRGAAAYRLTVNRSVTETGRG